MKTRSRFLSGLLAASLCLSLISPAALAQEEPIDSPVLAEEEFVVPPDSVEVDSMAEPAPAAESGMMLSMDGKTTVDFGETTRVYVDNAGGNAIIDVEYSTSDTSKVKVDDEGLVTWAPNYTPTQDTTVTITGTVSYYPGADTVFVENFNENNIVNLKFPQVGTLAAPYDLMTESKDGGVTARTGSYGVTTNTACNATNRRAILDKAQTGVVTFWYYDAYNDLERANTSALGLFLIGGSDTSNINNPPAVNFFGVGHHVSGGSTVANHYVYRDNSKIWTTLESDNKAVRSEGWHKFQYKVESSGTTLYIDGIQVGAKQSAPVNIASIGLGVNNGVTNGSDEDCVTGYHFIDDISMVSLDTFNNSAKLQTETLTKTITLKAAPAPAPVITDQPADEAATVGGTASFTVAATTTTEGGALSYQWYSCDKNGEKAVLVDNSNASAKTATLTLTGAVEGASYYYCAVTNSGGTMKSNIAKFVVNATGDLETGPAKDLDLAFTNKDGLRKGEESERVYLEGIDGLAIESASYTLTDGATNKVNLDADTGRMTVKAGQVIEENDTVTIKATVEYYTDADDKVQFVDNFVGAQNFKETTFGTTMYRHSPTNARYGLTAATPTGTTGKGNASIYTLPTALTPSAETNYTAWAWLYDPGTTSTSALKWAVGVGAKGATGMNVAVIQDSDAPVAADPATTGNGGGYPGKYVYRNNGGGSKWYHQGNGINRTEGWHKIVWNVSTTGADAYIQLNGTGELLPIYKDADTKVIQDLKVWTNWSHKDSANNTALLDKFFVDGFTVITDGAAKATKEVSLEVSLLDIAYTHAPETISVDSTYPSDLSVVVNPYIEEDGPVKLQLDGVDLATEKWSFAKAGAPVNASFYPAEMKGLKLTVAAEALKGIADGSHKLTMITQSGSAHNISFTAKANTHEAKEYYLSNSGNDSNTGNSPTQAWATFEKLNTVTFGPGDSIYLDATSFWNGVQFRPVGSGAPGAPIVMTKYNDGSDPSKRPILNGNGTVADKDVANGGHSYLAFDAWRKFYPSGTVELFNVEYWEVNGLEITNYTSTYTQGATGRNGIAIIYDFYETRGLTSLPGTDKDKEEEFYRAGKLQHVIVEDNYIHDVTGYHPSSGASGAGGKMSGGINAYGPYDDLKLDNNIIMYCDVEGIRNDVLAWRGDTRTQFPAYMENVSISNNFIVGVPGDGVVISSATTPRLANNYLADAGYSYMVDKAGSTTAAKPMGNRNNPVIISQSTNFAGLWFIGTGDAVCEYNEAVNNVWTCQDGEAFDADMYCAGTMFQYNYTYRNNGGFALFMGSMDKGTVVRYNVSVEDGEGIGSAGGKKATFYYNGAPDAIYNNLFILGENVKSMFGGSSNSTYFYNNMVIKPDGDIGSFHLNGNGSDDTTAPALSGEIKNNLFYPATIINNVTGSVTKADNITPSNLDGIFYDLDTFLAAQPVQALNGRSALTGTLVNMISGKGAGVAISAKDGKNATAPDGTGFDYTQFEGIKTVDGAPVIGAGIPVTLTYPGNDAFWPLTTDFFKNSLNGVTTPDIGPYQWSSDASHFVKLTYQTNGADALDPTTAASKSAASLPIPSREGYAFQGWFDNDALAGDAVSNSFTVPNASTTLYAKWAENASGTYNVTFNSQGGSTVAPANGVIEGSITRPADPTKSGYTFGGWYKDISCSDAWDFSADTVVSDITLFAKWEGNTFTVTFDKNGGNVEAAPAAMTVTYPATTLKMLPDEPIRTSFNFVGWNTQADGMGTLFTAGTKVLSDITVYAVWEENTTGEYSVVFDKNGGDTEANPNTLPLIYPATSLGSLPAAPTRTGYEFAGWNTKADGTGGVFTRTTKVTNHLKVYAQWKPIGSYTVTYDKNGGDTEAAPAFQIVVPPATNVGTLPAAPSRSGYTFTGWNTTKTGSGTAFTGSTEVTGNVTVYAQWQVYTPAPSPSTPKPKPEEKPAENVTATEGGQVTVKENKDGSSTYTFKPEKEKDVLYVRVNGLLVKADSYTAAKGETPSIVVVFGESGTDHSKDYADTAALPEYMTEAVNYVVGSGLFRGNGESFVPMGNMNRAMFATVLSRLYGADTTKLTSDFADVAQGSWYEGSVAWISDMGITSGVGGGNFAPEADMTRQELVTLVYRFAQKVGADVSATGALTAFPDGGSVDAWSTDAMSWAVGLGMITGKDGSLAPNDTITRVEAAIILQRMADLLVKA